MSISFNTYKMHNAIHTDGNVVITCIDRTTTEFYDAETERKLFVNLPASKVLKDIHTLKDHILCLDNCHVSVAEEGTTLRVFYNKGRWYTSTKRKLQAFKSSWADKTTTFGATFAQAVRNELGIVDDTQPDRAFLEHFYETYLHKDQVYFFILRNTAGERIVCDPPENAKAMHICTQKNYINDFHDRIIIDDKTFTHTTELPLSFEAIGSTLASMNYRHHQGVIVEKEGVFYKILIPTYAKFAAVRGEMPSLRMCYLKLRNPKTFHERGLFLENYPSFNTMVDPLETKIYDICCQLHRLYLDKYIHKIQFNLTQNDLKALKIIHHAYLESRIPTTPQKINDILTTHPVLINHLLKDKKKIEKSSA